jgi:hypothetical protein
MLTNGNELKGLTIRATDGELGTVDQFYFDDEIWAIRYLTVETGGWLSVDGSVLISPYSITNVDWRAKRLDVALTKAQVENSPEIDTHQPVSRQHEAAYLGYFGYPYYWGGPYLWGPGYYPIRRRRANYSFPGDTWRIGSGKNRRIHTCAVTKPLQAIPSRRPTATSGIWPALWWTMKAGRSDTSRWRRGTGGRARKCWCRLPGSNG